MSQIIVYKNQEELLSEIIKMEKEVKDIVKRIKEKQNELNSLADNLNIDSARSVTASVRSDRPRSYDVSEEAKNVLNKLYTDIKNMKNEAAAIRMSIKVMKNDLENVKEAAKSDTARGKSPISNNTSISTSPFVIIKNEISPEDAKYILINKLDKGSVALLNTLYDAFTATKASSFATRALSPDARRASSSKSSSASGALSPAARRASSSASGASSSASGASSSASGASSYAAGAPSSASRASSSASRASSPSSNTYGLPKRRGKI